MFRVTSTGLDNHHTNYTNLEQAESHFEFAIAPHPTHRWNRVAIEMWVEGIGEWHTVTEWVGDWHNDPFHNLTHA